MSRIIAVLIVTGLCCIVTSVCVTCVIKYTQRVFSAMFPQDYPSRPGQVSASLDGARVERTYGLQLSNR